MGNYTNFQMSENPRRGRQARNFTTKVPKILDLKSSSEQIQFPKIDVGCPCIDVLKSWADAQGAQERDDDRANPGNIILWNNKNIAIAGKSICWKDWHAAGTERICDLLNENSKLLSYEDFCSLLLISTVLLRPFQTNGNVQLSGWTLISVSRS